MVRVAMAEASGRLDLNLRPIPSLRRRNRAGQIVDTYGTGGFSPGGASLIDVASVLAPDASYSISEATPIKEGGQIVGVGMQHGSAFPTSSLIMPALEGPLSAVGGCGSRSTRRRRRVGWWAFDRISSAGSSYPDSAG
jgi:hypothetical protein